MHGLLSNRAPEPGVSPLKATAPKAHGANVK
jgi:hypothetical protein